MRAVTYISKESIKAAEDMERRFLSLVRASGVLFVGVSPVPTEDGVARVFTVTVGVTRSLDEGTATALAKNLLSMDIPEGSVINVIPVRGISGPASTPENTH